MNGNSNGRNTDRADAALEKQQMRRGVAGAFVGHHSKKAVVAQPTRKEKAQAAEHGPFGVHKRGEKWERGDNFVGMLMAEANEPDTSWFMLQSHPAQKASYMSVALVPRLRREPGFQLR